MSHEDDDLVQPQDRRLSTLYHELDKKVHALELSDVAKTIEIASLKGEVSGLRSSSATSADVAAASRLIDVKLDHLHKDLSTIKAILMWATGLILAAVAGAVLNLVLKS